MMTPRSFNRTSRGPQDIPKRFQVAQVEPRGEFYSGALLRVKFVVRPPVPSQEASRTNPSSEFTPYEALPGSLQDPQSSLPRLFRFEFAMISPKCSDSPDSPDSV